MEESLKIKKRSSYKIKEKRKRKTPKENTTIKKKCLQESIDKIETLNHFRTLVQTLNYGLCKDNTFYTVLCIFC